MAASPATAEPTAVPPVPPVAAAPLVALVGNPNTGKSALFNRLTGSRQRVGNFPGLTVEKRVGRLRLGDRVVQVLDLPGLYSLDALSTDEWIVHDVLAGKVAGTARPDVVVCVLDAGNLRRNLYLVTQVARMGLPLVLALNMIDEAREAGLTIDDAALSARLGVPVVPTSATRGEGLAQLRDAIARALGGPPSDTVAAISGLGEMDAAARYAWIGTALEGVVAQRPVPRSRRAMLDAVLTHRVLGLACFMAVMYVVFTAIYAVADPFMGGIEAAFAWAGDTLGARVEHMPMLHSLVVDGVIAGVGGVVVFLPQILILFFFISLLEDTGYMARAAFLMDRLFSWCGLSGKSFVPLLSSYACAIPGIMATRTIEDPKARLTTILIAPLMSCSARLPVYVLLIGAFIEPRYGTAWAGFALFAMHLLGLVVALPMAWLLNRVMLRGRGTPFVLELPPYRWPAMRDVLWRMLDRGREFVLRAGTIIFAMSIVIWAMCYFPRPAAVEQQVIDQARAAATIAPAEAMDPDVLRYRIDSAYLEQSYMGRLGKAVQPVFAPAGFDWKITVSVLASFPAREVIISTMGIVYGLGGDVDEESDSLRTMLQTATRADGTPAIGVPVAAAIMVFFALCMQCGATVAVIAREAGWTWAVFAFTYMTVLAWAGAVLTYQIAQAVA